MLVKETKAFVGNRERAGHIKTKGRADYVTRVDTDIQNFLARELGSRFPAIQFLGEEVYHAGKGKGSFQNGSPIHVSEAETLSETMIAVGTSPYDRELAKENFKRIRRVFDSAQDIRRTGTGSEICRES